MDQQTSAQPQPKTDQPVAEAPVAAPAASTPPAQPAAPAQPETPAPAAPATTPAVAAPAAGTPATPNSPAGSPAPAAPTTPNTPAGSQAPAAPAKKSPMKVLLAVLAVAILAGGGVVAYQMTAGKTMYQGESTMKKTNPVVTTAPSPTVGAVKSGDAQLDQQSDAIDTSMDKLNSDVSNVDKGLQDKSEDLSQ